VLGGLSTAVADRGFGVVIVTAPSVRARPTKVPPVVVISAPRGWFLEVRSRHRRGVGDPPVHVARLRAAGHDHREVRARESAGREGPDLEKPRPRRGPVERQRAGQRGCRVEADDAGRERDAGEGAVTVTSQGTAASASYASSKSLKTFTETGAMIDPVIGHRSERPWSGPRTSPRLP